MSKQMKRWLVVAAVLIGAGLLLFAIVMVMQGGDFMTLSTEKYEANTVEVTDAFRDIALQTDTAGITFAVSDDGACRVVCYESEKEKHAVTVKDGVLTVSPANEKKWYDYIGVRFGTPTITVYLPQGEYGELSIHTDTGFVTVPSEFRFERMDIVGSTGVVTSKASVSDTVNIQTSTGAIRVEGVTAMTVNLSVSTGTVTVSDVTCEGDVTVRVSTGKARVIDTTCRNLTSVGSTGDLSLQKVVAADAFSIERDTGDVKLDGCDAATIVIETDTGDVKGSLLSDKVFIVQTDTGRVDVPKTITGGRCEITTDTGDVVIR